MDFSKISCLKQIQKITFNKTAADLKTKDHAVTAERKGIFKAAVIAEGLISV